MYVNRVIVSVTPVSDMYHIHMCLFNVMEYIIYTYNITRLVEYVGFICSNSTILCGFIYLKWQHIFNEMLLLSYKYK